MVLQHVPGGAGGVVEAGPGADADVLGHGDLHRVDVLGVPQRLEQVVGEPQGEDVLDRLLAQVVVDPEDVLAGEDVVDQVVERLRRRQVVAERLLHHHPPPAAGLGVVRHAGAGELLEHHRERRRRDGEVEGGVARDAVGVAQLVQGRGEVVERGVVVERAADELDVAGQPRPHLLPPRGPGVLLRRLVGQRLEVAVAPVAAGEARAPRSRAAAAPGWPGRRPPAAASCGPGRRSPRRSPERTAPGSAAAAGPAGRAAGSRRLLAPPGSRHSSSRPCRPAASSSWATPAARSVRCSRSTGRSRPARACRSPAAWAA